MPTLHWLNDEEARKLSGQVPYRLLETDPRLSYGDAGTENMLIQGDNLEALKALLPYYAGQVKCIYIDPPYNTQSAFAQYEDNLEHATWLTMMYPRFELLRDLLTNDGSLWVQLDDNEMHYAKILLDEIFGRNNFVANIIWQKSYAVRSNAQFFSTSTEHLLVFAKSRNGFSPNQFSRSETQLSRFSSSDNDPRGPWQSVTMTISLVGGQRGRQFARTGKSENIYEVISPSGKIFLPPSNRCWSRSKGDFEKLDTDRRIYWGINGDKVPRLKLFLHETNDGILPTTLWAGKDFGFNQDGVRELQPLNLVFPTPKPELLICRILNVATNKDDIVLDSFLGSGTTAAVAHKMSRRYIGIEMGDHAITHCVPRLKKVIDSEQGGISKTVNWQGGGGFNFYRLGETIFDEQGHINEKVKFKALAAHVWFSETHTPLPPHPPLSKSENGGITWESPLLGVHNETAYYLLYNGILGDMDPKGGNVLTSRVLRQLPKHKGKKVIYGEMSMLEESVLRKEEITFKHIPYDIKAR